MGKKKKKKEETARLTIDGDNNRVALILNSYHEIDSIFVTMLYNAQRSVIKKADIETTDFLQRLLNQVSEKLIYTISYDVQTLALIEHWGLEHPAFKGQLNKLLIDRAFEDAPDGIHIKDVHVMADKYKSGIMFEADRRATEAYRHAMNAAQTDTRFTVLTLKSNQ